jgi:phosphatidylglycerophosphate synthase
MTDVSNRRPLKSRGSSWAQGLARDLAKRGVSPDQISFLSLAFAFVGAGAFALSGQTFGGSRVVLLMLAALGIQLRLLCNLLDGMVAVEHGKGGPHGPIWNELPDRISDAVLMMGAGLAASPAGAAWGVALGAACALLAVLTAYVRELGRGLGFPADSPAPWPSPSAWACSPPPP